MPPTGKDALRTRVQELVDKNPVMVFSKSYCPYCIQVKELFTSLGKEYVALELDECDDGSSIQEVLHELTGLRTVPSVFVNKTHVGGCDKTLQAHRDGTLQKLLDKDAVTYDYDLIVIGGGSGGLACSKEASSLGKKVMVFDYVVPTPLGTSWGLGGTCVNVGCIPKKLMHQAALLGHSLKDSRKFGWEYDEQVQHNWDTMRQNIQDYIGSLNWGYRVSLRDKNVRYENAYAEFVEPHKIKATNRKGKESFFTAEKFVIATGERPRYLGVPGDKEFCITSDDLFSLSYCPGKTLVVGASYVALECAGFLAGIGLDVTVMVRSIFLRGFDQEMAEKAGAYMESHGVKFIKKFVPTSVEQLEPGMPGRLRVVAKSTESDQIIEGEYNTVLVAVGRDSCTRKIGLEKIGVTLNERNGKIPVNDEEQTNVPSVYAIGDILDGKWELTPVAIKAGRLLARRLYGGANLKVYHTLFWPLEWTVPGRDNNKCFAKIICNKLDYERVVGFHVLGPNAGEITQGYAAAMKCGLTKEKLDETIGIHPTCAEIFTTMEVTKSSGGDISQKGC
ncbi:PREDICTED: thioredoxin reductase 3 isoform X2 [Nanorana parkeri]|uniref:thioredoxin reductase 3 isoform X2 n=1 Tax=Nanorana parkeri TaxID=125878 RepID=UPI0008541B0E|nr:PREDICTED: thioredoxin reductase 3 isoform X2 [Nanorana parkeri]